jgi:hypothetical protein
MLLTTIIRLRLRGKGSEFQLMLDAGSWMLDPGTRYSIHLPLPPPGTRYSIHLPLPPPGTRYYIHLPLPPPGRRGFVGTLLNIRDCSGKNLFDTVLPFNTLSD